MLPLKERNIVKSTNKKKNNRRRKVKINPDTIPEIIETLLNTPFWLHSITPQEQYIRLHDDHDGKQTGTLHVQFDQYGDAYIWILGDERERSPNLRFRMPGSGGGMSEFTRTAILVLALAIKMDNDKRPIQNL